MGGFSNIAEEGDTVAALSARFKNAVSGVRIGAVDARIYKGGAGAIALVSRVVGAKTVRTAERPSLGGTLQNRKERRRRDRRCLRTLEACGLYPAKSRNGRTHQHY